MSTVALQRGFVRWREWTPLITQQQRLRSVIQVIAYNVKIRDDVLKEAKTDKVTFFFTLHISTLSPPFYTSEKLESENPKWAEIEYDRKYGSANGVVVRLWADLGNNTDHVVTVWGVYFSGLVYIGPQLLTTDPSALSSNAIVFHMHGGYFTASHCFLNAQPATPRTLTIQLNSTDVKPSYSVGLLLRLQGLQQQIRKQSEAADSLRKQISEGCFKSYSDEMATIKGSAALRKLMSKPVPPRAHPQQILAVKRQIERVKFRIQLLAEEKEREESLVNKLTSLKDSLRDQNQDKESELTNSHHNLQKVIERNNELRRRLLETKKHLTLTNKKLEFRRRELMANMSYIYPIKQLADGKYTIRDVHLPDSEDFDGKDDLMISVALGFVAHLVQTMAYFLNVPTRYPICHFGSRSKIIDHIPNEERECPLYSRGKEKLFDYGVFLLNKNIAQLRWCCGHTTTDLRPTLHNLATLMNLQRSPHELPLTREWTTSSTKRNESKQTSLSFSLDRGLDSVTGQSPETLNSDPQDYLQTRRTRYDTEPVGQLNRSILLEMTPKSSESLNGQNTSTPETSSSPLNCEQVQEASS